MAKRKTSAEIRQEIHECYNVGVTDGRQKALRELREFLGIDGSFDLIAHRIDELEEEIRSIRRQIGDDR